jgi:hypothetical protein
MKRKTYLVQSAVGQSAIRHTFNAAMNDAAKGMVRDYAEANGLRGPWSLADSGREQVDGVTVHGWRVWRHDATGHGLRIVANLQP